MSQKKFGLEEKKDSDFGAKPFNMRDRLINFDLQRRRCDLMINHSLNGKKERGEEKMSKQVIKLYCKNAKI